MKILVTGHLGFVGSHFYRYFDNHPDHSVLGIDIRDDPPTDAMDLFRYSDVSFDLIVHCAAVIPDIASRVANPLPMCVDFALDASLFQYAARTHAAKVVYFSSCAAYPTERLENPLVRLEESLIERSMVRPDTLYGITKYVGELQAQAARQAGVDVLIVRPFSGYGSDQSLNYPFPAMIRRALDGADPFDVWGDGNQTRDFVHIDDIVGCVLALLEARQWGPVNVGNGIPVSMKNLATIICSVANVKPFIRYLAEKPTGVRHLVADTTLMNRYYRPKVELLEGVERALLENEYAW